MHNLRAFEKFIEVEKRREYKKLILDSCCGTGHSSNKLAQSFDDSLVVGIDQSQARLAKNPSLEGIDNRLLLRANCEDFWRLCQLSGVRFDSHYILYPNPWPKPEHLLRRWHGHPVFPVLSEIASTTVLRSNWKLYLDEFNLAWQHLTGRKFKVETLEVDDAISLFEKKYNQSGQPLYQLVVSA